MKNHFTDTFKRLIIKLIQNFMVSSISFEKGWRKITKVVGLTPFNFKMFWSSEVVYLQLCENAKHH